MKVIRSLQKRPCNSAVSSLLLIDASGLIWTSPHSSYRRAGTSPPHPRFILALMVTQPPKTTGFPSIRGGSGDPTTHLLAALFLLAGTLWLIVRLSQKSIRNLPPGPKGLPLIGDVLHVADHGWLASPQRKDDYGDNSAPLMLYINARSCTVQVT